jgi:hypothetical protein
VEEGGGWVGISGLQLTLRENGNAAKVGREARQSQQIAGMIGGVAVDIGNWNKLPA